MLPAVLRQQNLTDFHHSDLLGQLIDIASSIPEGKGQLARAYFKLAVLQDGRGRHDNRDSCTEIADALMSELKPDAGGPPYSEDDFNSLCVWMLW
jgi:hypothetical protein